MNKYTQLPLLTNEKFKPLEPGQVLDTNGFGNRVAPDDRAFHDWYRFVLSYPPHLVHHYINSFGLSANQVILDPFCGTGTTLVEAKRNGLSSVGVEANPIAYLASSVKTNWQVDSQAMSTAAVQAASETLALLAEHGIDDRRSCNLDDVTGDLLTLPDEKKKLLLENSISPLPLHKVLTLQAVLAKYSGKDFYNHFRLALAKTIVFHASNLHFGPEVGVGKPKPDTPVVSAWLSEVKNMLSDLQKGSGRSEIPCRVFLADARNLSQVVAPGSIDAVITSPPYPNEKDYTRTTRLESVILGLIEDKEDLRRLKKSLVRSNTRGVYKEDDDDQWILANQEVHAIADAIERRRIELGKTSGFERQYSRVTRLYFGGMARHLRDIQTVLRPGAQLAYVVGDQASYLRILIRTGHLLARIAEEIGYEVVRIDLFRTRFATATKQELREEVVVLRWKGT